MQTPAWLGACGNGPALVLIHRRNAVLRALRSGFDGGRDKPGKLALGIQSDHVTAHIDLADPEHLEVLHVFLKRRFDPAVASRFGNDVWVRSVAAVAFHDILETRKKGFKGLFCDDAVDRHFEFVQEPRRDAEPMEESFGRQVVKTFGWHAEVDQR
jgi:hypothetical protein